MSQQNPLADLPVIIDAPGEYVTRLGKKVTIHAIHGPGFFEAKGSVWKTANKMGNNPQYSIWHVSGRHMPLAETTRDIVGKAS